MAAAVDRNVKLLDFDGTSMSITEWIQHVEICKTAAGWNDVQTNGRAKIFLKGPAMVWLQNRIREGTEGLNAWYLNANEAGVRAPNLRTLLMDRFLLTNTPAEQARLRATLQQHETEDTSSFYDRVESIQYTLDESFPEAFRVGQKAHYDIVHGNLVLSAFINGLKAEIRAHVTTLNVATSQEARDAAVAYEMANSKKSKIHLFGTNPEVQNQEALINQLAALGFKQHNPNYKGGKGKNSYKNKGDRGNYSGGNQQSRSDDKDGCHYCGFLGHNKPQCRSKTRDVANGIHRDRSEFYAPGRVSQRGCGRGAQQRGYGAARGHAYEMRTDPNPASGSQQQQPPLQSGFQQQQPPPQQNFQPLAGQQQFFPEQGQEYAFNPYRFFPEN